MEAEFDLCNLKAEAVTSNQSCVRIDVQSALVSGSTPDVKGNEGSALILT